MTARLLAAVIAVLATAMAVGGATVSLGPEFAAAPACADVTFTDGAAVDTLPIVGLNAATAARQCLKLAATAPALGGLSTAELTLDLTGLDAYVKARSDPTQQQPQYSNYGVRLVAWNVGKLPATTVGGVATTSYVTFSGGSMSGSPTDLAAAGELVVANGVVTGVTITQPGRGYLTAPSVNIIAGPTVLASSNANAIAVINSQGSVIAVKITSSTSGWTAPLPTWDTATFTTAQLETLQQGTVVSPSLPSSNDPTPVTTYFVTVSEMAKDSTQCQCTVPTAAVCACVPYGLVLNTGSGIHTFSMCTTPIVVKFALSKPITFAVTAVLVSNLGLSAAPVLAYNDVGTFTTILNSFTTNVRLAANYSVAPFDPARRWLKEIRVTLTTPMNENWFCLPSTYTDCTVSQGTIAAITTDRTALPIYNSLDASHIWAVVSPATRGILGINLVSGGSGYTSRPGVTITRPGTIYTLASVVVMDGGSGYSQTQPPVVTVNGASGAGVGCAATVSAAGVVTAITGCLPGSYGTTPPQIRIVPFTSLQTVYMTACGSGYLAASPPTVVVQTATVTASCTPVIENGAVTGCTVSELQQGSGYSAGTVTVAFYSRLLTLSATCTTGCTVGSGFVTPTALQPITPTYTLPAVVAPTFTYSVVGGALTVTIATDGLWLDTTATPFISFDQAGATQQRMQTTFTPGVGAAAYGRTVPKVTTAALARAVLSPNRQPAFGSPFRNPYAYITSAQVRVVMSQEDACSGIGSGSVASIIVDDPGSNYLTGTTITIDSPSGAGTTATATVVVASTATDATISSVAVSNGLITGVTIGDKGSGYTSPPNVQFMFRRRVISITITNGGSGYTQAPLVGIDAPASGLPWDTSSRSTATATAVITAGVVTSVEVVDPGWGYLASPTVTFTPRGEIVSITLACAGAGYTTAPTVCISAPLLGGFGAKATASISSGGVVTGITIVSGGQGYSLSGFTITLIGGGYTTLAYTSATARYVTLGSGSGATATAQIERGDGATVLTTIAAGELASVTMVRGGPVIERASLVGTSQHPYWSGAADNNAYIRQQIDSNGLPTEVTFAHPTINRFGSTPTLLSNLKYRDCFGNLVSAGLTHRVWLGASTAQALLVGSSGAALPAPTASSLQPQTKVWSFADVEPRIAGGYYYLALTAPSGAGVTRFPSTEWNTNTYMGSSELGAAFYQPSVKVEFFEYANINRLWASGSLVYGDRVKFQVNLSSQQWSKINFTFNATGTGQSSTTLAIRWLNPLVSTTWNVYNPATGVRRKATGNYLSPEPNTAAMPIIVELSLGSCTGPVDTIFNFNIRAQVYDFQDEGGECNTYLNCRRERGHPTPSGRLSLSANPDSGRFRDCVVGPSGFTGFCTECTSRCDCNLGQYCHLDNGLCTVNGVTFICDKESRAKYGTCQQKDPSGSILGQQCHAAGTSDVYGNTVNNDGAQALGFCGRSQYYNSSWASTSQNGTARYTLWTGQCINHQCRECEEQTSDCTDSRFCADGFWTQASGTNVNNGKVAAARTDAVQQEVYRNSQISASFLAFIVIITVVLCVAIVITVRSNHPTSVHPNHRAATSSPQARDPIMGDVAMSPMSSPAAASASSPSAVPDADAGTGSRKIRIAAAGSSASAAVVDSAAATPADTTAILPL